MILHKNSVLYLQLEFNVRKSPVKEFSRTAGLLGQGSNSGRIACASCLSVSRGHACWQDSASRLYFVNKAFIAVQGLILKATLAFRRMAQKSHCKSFVGLPGLTCMNRLHKKLFCFAENRIINIVNISLLSLLLFPPRQSYFFIILLAFEPK